MADDLHKKRPEDSSRISLTVTWEVEYWTKSLGITEQKLRQAGKAAGNSVTAVKKWLSEQK